MSYSSLIDTQFVSNINLQDAVTSNILTLKPAQTIPVNSEIINKAELLTLINASPTNSFLSAKTNSQLISKRDITGNNPQSFNYFFTTQTGEFAITNNTTSTVVVLLNADGMGYYSFVSGNTYTIESIGTAELYLKIENLTTNVVLYEGTTVNPTPNSFTLTPTTDSYNIVASAN